MKEFLDKSGVITLWNKIKQLIDLLVTGISSIYINELLQPNTYTFNNYIIDVKYIGYEVGYNFWGTKFYIRRRDFNSTIPNNTTLYVVGGYNFNPHTMILEDKYNTAYISSIYTDYDRETSLICSFDSEHVNYRAELIITDELPTNNYISGTITLNGTITL